MAQLAMKPMWVMSAALASRPTDTHKKPLQWPLAAPDGSSMSRKPPHTSKPSRMFAGKLVDRLVNHLWKALIRFGLADNHK